MPNSALGLSGHIHQWRCILEMESVSYGHLVIVSWSTLVGFLCHTASYRFNNQIESYK